MHAYMHAESSPTLATMAMKRTTRGGWQVRWRDEYGRQRAQTFREQSDAIAFQAEQIRVREQETEADALRAVHREIETTKTMRSHTEALSLSIDPTGFYVYCLWGTKRHRPIYVGMSANVVARVGDHLRDPLRRHLIKRVTLTRCETWQAMVDLEFHLIRRFQPELNIRGVA